MNNILLCHSFVQNTLSEHTVVDPVNGGKKNSLPCAINEKQDVDPMKWIDDADP